VVQGVVFRGPHELNPQTFLEGMKFLPLPFSKKILGEKKNTGGEKKNTGGKILGDLFFLNALKYFFRMILQHF
jgi:hypothetical protein